jgi:hypothetical protein
MARKSSQTTGPGFRPVSVVEAHDRHRRPRVPGPVLGIVVLALIVMGALAVVYVVITYKPVETGTTFAVGRFAKTDGGRLPKGDVRLRFRANRGTSFGMSLRNGGRLTVKLTRVTIPDQGTIVRQTSLRLPPEGSTTVVPDETLPFHPVQLDPGEEQFVVVVLRFGERCPRDAIAVIDSVHVHYSLFGIAKEMSVRLRQRITVPCDRKKS